MIKGENPKGATSMFPLIRKNYPRIVLENQLLLILENQVLEK